MLNRRSFFTGCAAGAAVAGAYVWPRGVAAQEAARDVFFERSAEGMPHKGKVLLAVQAHSDDIPLTASGTVAKLVKEGYTGYLVRATNDDMGDAPGLGTPGTVGDHVLGNERDNAEVARVLGLKKVFDLNYPNHRMADISQNELQCRLIFLIRLLKVDTWSAGTRGRMTRRIRITGRSRGASRRRAGWRGGRTIFRSNSRRAWRRRPCKRSTITRGGRKSRGSWM
jgi:hypothetical protein